MNILGCKVEQSKSIWNEICCYLSSTSVIFPMHDLQIVILCPNHHPEGVQKDEKSLTVPYRRVFVFCILNFALCTWPLD